MGGAADADNPTGRQSRKKIFRRRFWDSREVFGTISGYPRDILPLPPPPPPLPSVPGQRLPGTARAVRVTEANSSLNKPEEQ